MKKNWIDWGEFWNKKQVVQGKEQAKKHGWKYFKTKKGTYLGSYTLMVSK